jgi:hypothetical protein
MNLITDAIKELERLERVDEYDFTEAIGLLHQANKAQNKALFIPRVVRQSEQLVFCKHITTRNPKEHQENKCRFCGLKYQKN